MIAKNAVPDVSPDDVDGDGVASDDVIVRLRDVSFTYALGDAVDGGIGTDGGANAVDGGVADATDAGVGGAGDAAGGGVSGMTLASAPALRHVSLEVRAGEVVMLCGRSGCGKTTVTRVLNGLIPGFFHGRLEGTATVCGLHVGADGGAPVEAFVPLVGSVFQNPKTQYFNAGSTDELAFPCENLGWEPERIRARVAEVAARFGVGGLLGRNVFALSGGQRQRLAVAAAMMPGPRLMVMDEPTGNLDAKAMRDLHDLVARLKADGVTVVIAEHRLAWCADLVDRYVLFEDGAVAGAWTGAQFAALDAGERESWGLRALDLTPYREELRCRMHGGEGDSSPSQSMEGTVSGELPHAEAVRAPVDARAPRNRTPAQSQRTSLRAADAQICAAAIVGQATAFAEIRTPTKVADHETHTRQGLRPEGAAGAPVIATRGLVIGHRRWLGRPTFARPVPDLEIHGGRITGLMGPNGAGKTTLVRTLCGLAKPISGQVLIRGRRAGRTAPTHAGFLVMQDVNYQLFADSVRGELLLGTDTDGAHDNGHARESGAAATGMDGAAAATAPHGPVERADRILRDLDLLGFVERHPMSLSGGQKQRLAIATAIMCGKELVVLDEPTSGLDRHHMMRVGALLRSLADQGRAVLVVTHDEELAARWCDGVIALT